MGETFLFSVYGVTDGTSTTGTFSLNSDVFTNTPSYLKFDKNVKVKIWARRVSGAATLVHLKYTNDVTVTTPTWITLDTLDLASAGQLDLEKRRPILIICRTGKEAIRIDWEQTTAGVSYVAFDIEGEPLD